MAEQQDKSSPRRYPHRPNDFNSPDHEQLIPMTMERHKRHRSNDYTQFFPHQINPIDHSNVSMTNNRKRSAQDDSITYSTHSFFRDHEQSLVRLTTIIRSFFFFFQTNKRARYEHSNSTELENQPPRSPIKRRALFDHHQEQDLSSTWNPLRTHTNEFPLFFNDPHSTRTTTTYHRTHSVPNSDHPFTDHFSSILNDYHPHSIFHENSPLIISNPKSKISNTDYFLLDCILGSTISKTLSPQSNGLNPLRTTNCFLDTKCQTIIRTGNISPAHSDSSSESTSTCSSDDQLHHHQYPFHQPQPWRSYRERENYEQLLDLAEKLSDPNRFNQVDVQQFFSYRYKTSILTSCVICMSHFKNGQHIRVLPCQHEYHSKCIARWFTMNSSCPICRRDNFLSSC